MLQDDYRQDHDGAEFQPDMPPLPGLDDLLNLLFKIGPLMRGPTGGGPLTHGEIESAQRNLGIRLSPWECQTLFELSGAYYNESHAAEKRDCPPPWKPEPL